MEREDLEFRKKLAPLIMVFGMIGIITILFVYFYVTNYSKNIESYEREILTMNNTSTIIKEEPIEDFIVEEEPIEESISVFERDLKKKETLNYSKSLINTGNDILNKDLVADYKYEIMKYLYIKDFKNAKKIAKEINNKYDFFSEEFRDFEIFIYEVLNNFDIFENMGVIEKGNLISKLDSPELILFVFNLLSFDERRAVSRNKYSEIYDVSYSSDLGLVINSYGKDGLERAGAENVFFITSGYDAYAIKFSYFGDKYILYYLKDKTSNQTIIMGIDNLAGDFTTLKDYDYVYN